MTIDINLGIEETQPVTVNALRFAEDCELEILYADETAEITLSSVSVNRPGLALAGFYDYFASSRVQVLGNAEMYFLYKMEEKDSDKAFASLVSNRLPCIIISRGLSPTKNMVKTARENGCPLFRSKKITSELVNELINYLNETLAPKKSLHGELVEINGVGVLITGNSGIGKSETALELVHRGHRLVADDSVEVKRIKNKVIGSAAPAIRDFMEVRGVGIINVRNMFGVASVLSETGIDLIIQLEKWNDKKAYDRLGDLQLSENILGVEVPKLLLPVMPGRNIAVVVEVAARNMRMKEVGYDALKELEKRVF